MTEYDSRDERAELEAEFESMSVEHAETAGEISTVVSVRLRGEELKTVEQAAQSAGLALSTFIRQAAVGMATPVDVRAASAQAETIQAEARKLLALLHGDAA